MSNVEIHSEVFNNAYIPYLDKDTRTQIYYGGSSSGKSRFLAQRCIYDILKGGRNYLITRQVGRTIRGSVYNEICKVIQEWGLSALFSINKTDMVITCTNGYQILFAGLDDVEKLKSITPVKGEVTDIWCEEATEIETASYKQLIKRQRGGSEKTAKRITLSFNPILQTHWIYEEFFKTIGWADKQTEYHDEELSILKTTYKDNRFLTKQDIYDLEKEKDSYYYNVYTLGNWGVLGNTIFRHKTANDPLPGWYVEDLSGMKDQFVNHRVGLDFGFASDPAACPVTHYDRMHSTIYVYNELYETGLTNDLLADQLQLMVGAMPITADSAEPKSIAELQNAGLNVYAAKKGKDSVEHGIQWLQQQTIVVDKSCVNMQNELMVYKWKEDAGGHEIKIPVDRNNHLLDALRYAYESDSESTWWMS